jgi:uncharacterized repeat protein (TIGR04076 family)
MIMPDYKVSIEIVNILEEGECPAGHQIGETFEYPEERGKICPAAFHSIYPYIRVMESGGSFPWFDEPGAHSVCCPDYKRPVVFKISRKEV